MNQSQQLKSIPRELGELIEGVVGDEVTLSIIDFSTSSVFHDYKVFYEMSCKRIRNEGSLHAFSFVASDSSGGRCLIADFKALAAGSRALGLQGIMSVFSGRTEDLLKALNILVVWSGYEKLVIERRLLSASSELMDAVLKGLEPSNLIVLI